MEDPPPLKPLRWVASSKRDLQALPGGRGGRFRLRPVFGQIGKKHQQAKPLKGFGSAGVLEVVEDWQGGTYRAVYIGTLCG